jgi:transposase
MDPSLYYTLREATTIGDDNQEREGIKMAVQTIGIDLATHVFQLHGVDAHGRVVLRKKLSRTNLLAFLANLPRCLIGMEAGSGAHYWGREIRQLGHEVRLMSPHYVKPSRPGDKTNPNDAAAICEAVSRPHMRFVAIKSVEQQDMQALHRIREQLVKDRTALVNHIRGVLAEYGVVIPQGIEQVGHALPRILEEAENGLTAFARVLFAELVARLRTLNAQRTDYQHRIERLCTSHPVCHKLTQVEGVGPLGATALIAAVGDAHSFKSGRHMAAWLGFVPRQCSTGAKTRLLGMSKRGNRYVRTLLIHGARAVLRHATQKTDARSRWLLALMRRRGRNVAVVALANKHARLLWALMTRKEDDRKAVCVRD